VQATTATANKKENIHSKGNNGNSKQQQQCIGNTAAQQAARAVVARALAVAALEKICSNSNSTVENQ